MSIKNQKPRTYTEIAKILKRLRFRESRKIPFLWIRRDRRATVDGPCYGNMNVYFWNQSDIKNA